MTSDKQEAMEACKCMHYLTKQRLGACGWESDRAAEKVDEL